MFATDIPDVVIYLIQASMIAGGEHFLYFQHSTVLVQCLGIVGLVQFFSDFAKCLIYFPEL